MFRTAGLTDTGEKKERRQALMLALRFYYGLMTKNGPLGVALTDGCSRRLFSPGPLVSGERLVCMRAPNFVLLQKLGRGDASGASVASGRMMNHGDDDSCVIGAGTIRHGGTAVRSSIVAFLCRLSVIIRLFILYFR